MSLKTYLITGGAGFIGSHIAEELISRGNKVIIIDNLIAGCKSNMASFITSPLCSFHRLDVRYYNDIAPLFKNVDAVFHNAASKCTVCRKNPMIDLLTNAYGSLNVFRAAQYYGVKKVIHASTGSVNNGNPKSFYGVSKMTAEKYLEVMREYYPGFKYTVLQYYHVYGTRQNDSEYGGVIPIFIKNMLTDSPITIYGDGEQQRHFTRVSDVVKANIFALQDSCDYQTYQVMNPVSITINQLAATLREISGDKRYPIKFEKARKGDIKIFPEPRLRFPVKYDNDFVGGLKEIIDDYHS